MMPWTLISIVACYVPVQRSLHLGLMGQLFILQPTGHRGKADNRFFCPVPWLLDLTWETLSIGSAYNSWAQWAEGETISIQIIQDCFLFDFASNHLVKVHQFVSSKKRSLVNNSAWRTRFVCMILEKKPATKQLQNLSNQIPSRKHCASL